MEGGLSDEDQLVQTTLFTTANKPLGEGIQIRTPWGQENRVDPHRFEDLIKCGRELRISIVEQATATVEETLLSHRHVPSHLLHPLEIWLRRETGNADLPGRNADED
jgi:hypothetical protein